MKTCIDWLSFRTKSHKFDILEALRPCFGSAAELLTMKTGLKGRDGWEEHSELYMVDIRLGGIDSGGKSQRDWMRVQLSGEGCGWVQDWAMVQDLQKVLIEADVRRLDIALTTYKREVTFASVLEAYEAGKFKGRSGGVNPSIKTIVNGHKYEGDTIYIGQRTSDKFLRCYEKGKEATKDLPPNQRAMIQDYEGFPIDDVFRVELELKAKELFLPWEVIGMRDGFFAGAYPFCSEILANVPEARLHKLPDFKPRAVLTAALENCRNSYGPTLRAALEYFGGDRDKLLDAILADKPSRRLVDAGVLTI